MPCVGGRQLIVHNQHLVSFQLSGTPSGAFDIRSYVMSPFASHAPANGDFMGLLRQVLSGLSNWLDRLESALVSHLQTRPAGWLPDSRCPRILLPIGYPPGTTRYDDRYFPLPVCEGSDELPWSVTVGCDSRGVAVSPGD